MKPIDWDKQVAGTFCQRLYIGYSKHGAKNRQRKICKYRLAKMNLMLMAAVGEGSDRSRGMGKRKFSLSASAPSYKGQRLRGNKT